MSTFYKTWSFLSFILVATEDDGEWEDGRRRVRTLKGDGEIPGGVDRIVAARRGKNLPVGSGVCKNGVGVGG